MAPLADARGTVSVSQSGVFRFSLSGVSVVRLGRFAIVYAVRIATSVSSPRVSKGWLNIDALINGLSLPPLQPGY